MGSNVTASTTRRLLRHAGLTASGSSPSVDDLLDGPGSAAEFEQAMADLLMVFQSLNVELNNEIPSESAASGAEIPRDVAYAATEIARSLRAADKSHAAWVVDTAWLAVLAGDIDDIETHVRSEARAL